MEAWDQNETPMTPVKPCFGRFDMIWVNPGRQTIEMPFKYTTELLAYKNRLSGL
jgi:hypothetical protein